MDRTYPLFQFRHGDHVCVFYDSEDYLLQILTPFVADGLRRRERCFIVQTESVVRRLAFDLEFIGINLGQELERGTIEVHAPQQVYVHSGVFEPHKLMDMLLQSIEDSVNRGFSGFRSAGDLCWATEGSHDCAQLVGYEALVQESYPGRPAVGMCQYSLRSFPEDVLQQTLAHHRFCLTEPQRTTLYGSLSLRTGNAEAEIVADRFVKDPKYYYVAHPRQSRSPLGWGIESDFERAVQQSDALLRSAT